MDQTTNNAPATTQAWFAEDQKDFVTNKGWQAPADAIKSYQNLETLFGADKAGRAVVLPKDEADTEGWKQFRSKIGVPDAPEAYELPVPDGDPGEFAKLASNWMLKAGVPKTAAQALTKEWNDYYGGMLKQAEEADAAKFAQEETALKNEWGHNFDQKYELTLRAFREYGAKAGMNEDDVKAIQGVVGPAKLARLMSGLGESLKEDSFFAADTNKFGMSKADAEAKLSDIRTQRAAGKISFEQWQAEAEKLNRIIYG